MRSSRSPKTRGRSCSANTPTRAATRGGNLKKYWDYIESHDRVFGAFIWDWSDKAFREYDDEGRMYWLTAASTGRRAPLRTGQWYATESWTPTADWNQKPSRLRKYTNAFV